jgi:hypothetical protein
MGGVRLIRELAAVVVATGIVTSTPVAQGAECGAPGLPACPMQGWMRTSLAAPYALRDYEALAKALEKLAAHNPAPNDPAWQDWNRHAHSAALAARAAQPWQVVKSCAACHVKYRRRYVASHRNRAIE